MWPLGEDAVAEAAGDATAGRTLPAAALAAVVALVTVTAALVRTQQASPQPPPRTGSSPVDGAGNGSSARW